MEIRRQMVRDRGRHSLQARGRHTPVLWEQEVKKTERGRKEKRKQNNSNQENNNADSEQGPCIPNSSDTSLNSKKDYFMWAFLYGPLAIQFVSEERKCTEKKA